MYGSLCVYRMNTSVRVRTLFLPIFPISQPQPFYLCDFRPFYSSSHFEKAKQNKESWPHLLLKMYGLFGEPLPSPHTHITVSHLRLSVSRSSKKQSRKRATIITSQKNTQFCIYTKVLETCQDISVSPR